MRTMAAAILGAATTAILLGGGAAAWASIPDSAGRIITSCYDKNGGKLRVIDKEAGDNCAKSETELTWNQTGRKGDTGATGATGAPGMQGVQGPVGLTGAVGPAGAGSDGGPRYYVKKGTIAGAAFPDPFVAASQRLTVNPGDLTVVCDAGDAALSGQASMVSIQQNAGPGVTANPTSNGIGSVMESVLVIAADGTPIGSRSPGPFTVGMNVSASTMLTSPPTFFGSRSEYSITVTCVDRTL